MTHPSGLQANKVSSCCQSGVCWQVAGLDVGWGQQLDMQREAGGGRWVLRRELPTGRFPYKLIVDGRWTCSADHPTFVVRGVSLVYRLLRNLGLEKLIVDGPALPTNPPLWCALFYVGSLGAYTLNKQKAQPQQAPRCLCGRHQSQRAYLCNPSLQRKSRSFVLPVSRCHARTIPSLHVLLGRASLGA